MDPLETAALDEGMAALAQQTARLRELVEQERRSAAHRLAALEEEHGRTAERLAKVKDEALRLADQLARIDQEQATARATLDVLEGEKAAAVSRAEQLEREASAALVRVAELEAELVSLRTWSVSLPPAMQPVAISLHQAVARALGALDAAATAALAQPEPADAQAAFSRRWGTALRKIRYLLDIAHYTAAAENDAGAAGLTPARGALARARLRVAELANDPAAAPSPSAVPQWTPPVPELEAASALTTGPAGEPVLQLAALALQVDAAVNEALAAARAQEPLTAEQEDVVRMLADLWVDLYRSRPAQPVADVRSALAELLVPAGFNPVEPQVRGLLRPGYEMHGSLVCPPEMSGAKER